MMATELVIDFDLPATKAELQEALRNMCHRAKREMAVVGTPLRPTPWDQIHKQIDGLLDQLERTR